MTLYCSNNNVSRATPLKKKRETKSAPRCVCTAAMYVSRQLKRVIFETPCAYQSVYTNIKTGQTSLERPECDPYFVETDLFLKFTPEETEALSEVRFLLFTMGSLHPHLASPASVHLLFVVSSQA